MATASEPHRYTLLFAGTPDNTFLADYCPAGTQIKAGNACFTLFDLCADQAQVLGIIRHLHNLGCLLLQLEIEEDVQLGGNK